MLQYLNISNIAFSHKFTNDNHAYILTPGGASHTHSPVVKLANMRSLDFGSIISTHSNLSK